MEAVGTSIRVLAQDWWVMSVVASMDGVGVVPCTAVLVARLGTDNATRCCGVSNGLLLQ